MKTHDSCFIIWFIQIEDSVKGCILVYFPKTAAVATAASNIGVNLQKQICVSTATDVFPLTVTCEPRLLPLAPILKGGLLCSFSGL